MKREWLLIAPAACVLAAAMTMQAQDPAGAGQSSNTSSDQTHWYSPSHLKKLNPVPYVKKPVDYLRKEPHTASEQLAANPDEEKHLTAQLQSHQLLPSRTDLKDYCSQFKALDDCIAAIHASHNVGVKFECLKWNVTAAKPEGAEKTCTEPENSRPVTLEHAIGVLKPDADAREEAKNALRQARENISDAKS